MNGILLVDKPAGWTSNDVVCKLKGVLHERRIGHSGTLDPMATGLLPVFAGRATKAVEFAESDRKTYIAGITFGVVTDTQDITGNVLSECACSVSRDEFLKACGNFLGDIQQVPPMYSALKYKGRRLYDLARQGREVERPPRAITIYDISIIEKQEKGFLFSVTCSAGTYVRTLCHDIGQQLGCGACLSYLRRTACGAFSVEDAYTLELIQEKAEEGSADKLLLPSESLFSDLPEYVCTEDEEHLIKTGRSFASKLPEGRYRVRSRSGEFLMLAKAEAETVKSIKNFFEV